MNELTLQRSLRDQPPADPHYRPRLSAAPGVIAPAHASGAPAVRRTPSLPSAVRLAAAAGVVAWGGVANLDCKEARIPDAATDTGGSRGRTIRVTVGSPAVTSRAAGDQEVALYPRSPARVAA